MKFNRLLLMIGIVALASIFVMSTSFAATKKSETIYSNKISQYISENSYKTKIFEIKRTDILNIKKRGDDRKGNFKISVKNSFKNKYKINSVKVLYTYPDWEKDVEKKVYKTYKAKNKKSLTVKDLSAPENRYEFVKLVITYKTNKKLKQETTYLKNPYKYNLTTKFTGKTAIVKDITITDKTNFIHTIKVKTTNSKYKIKTFKVIFGDIIGTIYGYGKNNLVVEGPNPNHYDPREEGYFEITYY